MILLAIDPGPEESAYCYYDTEKALPESFGIVSNQHMRTLIQSYGGYVVIEEICSYGMPVGKEVFGTCIWIGRFWELALEACGKVALMPRLDVKLHICKSTKANDSTIRQALIDKFGPPGKKKSPGVLYKMKEDQWAALALAVTYAETKAADLKL